jgi:hypothetical protein
MDALRGCRAASGGLATSTVGDHHGPHPAHEPVWKPWERTIPGDSQISPEALQAIGELLQAAAQHGLGVAFAPDDEGWRISYILHGWPGWPSYQEYDLPGGRR